MNLHNYTLIDTVIGTVHDPSDCVLVKDDDAPTTYSEIREIGQKHGESLSDLLADPVQDLIDLYGSWGEHPLYCRADWKREVGEGETNLGYWDWTIQQEEIYD